MTDQRWNSRVCLLLFMLFFFLLIHYLTWFGVKIHMLKVKFRKLFSSRRTLGMQALSSSINFQVTTKMQECFCGFFFKQSKLKLKESSFFFSFLETNITRMTWKGTAWQNTKSQKFWQHSRLWSVPEGIQIWIRK